MNYKPSLEEIFHAALERTTARDRDEFLRAACDGDRTLRERVDALLASHGEAETFLEAPLIRPPSGPLETAPGTMIGPYKLLQEIGEGGMGMVYMAEQERPVRRKVALKVIKLGMDTKQVIARFEAERQALALMEHPNIARVLDAGATDEGRPFFVMELVRGVAIDEYCDKHHLSTRERLQLFMDACRAVQHAHQKGIIHRDIKPGNVLVTSHDGTPVVKIIDFGVAKAIHQKLTEKTLFTEFRQFVGTPEYMSPEQAEMSGLDVDTRSDIYSLGVLLYLLLVGTTPFDSKKLREAEYREMTRMIREDEPLTPSTRISSLALSSDQVVIDQIAKSRASEPSALVKLVRGDIDWIVMKAIEKDRTRRYDSASALADDVARHLKHEPVVAGPPSTLYRARKLYARNRGLALGVTVTGVGLLVGLALAIAGYTSAKREAERSNKISAALTGMLAVTGDDGAIDVDVEKVLETTRDVFGEDHATVAATLSAMAGQLRNAGELAGAEDLYREAVAIYRAAYGDDHRSVGRTLSGLGMAQATRGDQDAAQLSFREAIRIDNLQRGGGTLMGCEARKELAQILSIRGEHDEAEMLLREVIDILRAQPTDQSFEIMTVLEKLLLVALSSPRGRDMDPIYAEFVGAVDRAFPAGHLVPALARFGRAMYLTRNERSDEAEPALRRVLAQFRAMESPPPLYLFMVLDGLFQISRFRTEKAARDDADSILMQFLEIAPDIWGPDSIMLGKNYSYAAERFFVNGRLSDALVAAQGFLTFKHRSQVFGDAEGAVYQIGAMILAVAAQAAPILDDLHRALAVLDAMPSGEGESAERIALRIRVLRAAILFRLGSDPSLLSVLQSVREETDPDDDTTHALLDAVEQLARRP